MFPYNITLSVIFIGLALGIFFGAGSLPYQTDGIGPDTWPRLLSVLLGIGGVLLLIESLIIKAVAKRTGALSEVPFDFSSAGMRRIYTMVGVLAIFSLILHVANFLTASAFLVPACMLIIGERRWHRILMITAAVPVLVYIIFSKILGVPLP